MEYRPIKDLAKLEDNPRIITEDDFKSLVESIRDNKEFFEARPLLLSDRTGALVVIGGNQRLEAAKFLKLKKVPTYLFTGLTEDKEAEITIRDNVNSGQWDWDILSAHYNPEALNSWGVPVWNTPEAPDYSILDGDSESAADEMTGGVKRALQIEFRAEDYDLAADLVKRARDSGAYIGGILLEALKQPA